MGKKSTSIVDLPEDSEVEPSQKELKVFNSILNMKEKSPKSYHQIIKYVIFATLIFIFLSLPFTDRLIELVFPVSESWLILLGLKTVLFFTLFFIVFYMNRAPFF